MLLVSWLIRPTLFSADNAVELDMGDNFSLTTKALDTIERHAN